MPTFEEWRDRQFHEETQDALYMISQAQEIHHELRDGAAYIILRDYTKKLLPLFGKYYSAQQTAEVLEVIERLNKLTGQSQEP